MQGVKHYILFLFAFSVHRDEVGLGLGGEGREEARRGRRRRGGRGKGRRGKKERGRVCAFPPSPKIKRNDETLRAGNLIVT